MESEKLETWIRRERKGATRLRLLATEIGSQLVVAEWPRSELFEANPLEVVLAACADYCDSKGESVSFRLEWMRTDGTAVANCVHRHAPLEHGEGEPIARDAINADISVNRLLAFYMRKDENKDRLILGAIGAIFSPLEHTIRLQGQIMEQQGKQLLSLHQQLQAAREAYGTEDTEESRAEAIARAGALAKLAELAPVVLQAVLERAADRSRTNGAGEH